MGVFSVPVTIGVDEERIAESIEKNVESQVVSRIVDIVIKTMYDKRSYYSDKYDDPTPTKNMIQKEIHDILERREEEIVALAAEVLAEKLSRTKAVKEKAGIVAEKAGTK